MGDKAIVQQCLKDCEKIRPKIQTNNVEIQNYLDYQAVKIRQDGKTKAVCCSSSRADGMVVSNEFKSAFSRLSTVEKAQFYRTQCLLMEKCLNKEGHQDQVLDSQNIIRPAFAKEGGLFSGWKDCDVVINLKNKTIKISKLDLRIDLHSYILRKSKGMDKKSIVLEPTRDLDNNRSLRLAAAKEYQFQELQDILVKINQLALQQNYQKMLGLHLQQRTQKKQSYEFEIKVEQDMRPKVESQNEEVPRVGLLKLQHIKEEQIQISQQTQQNSGSGRNLDHLITGKFIYSLQNFSDYTEISKGVFFEKNGNKVRRIFTLKTDLIRIEQLADELMNVARFNRWKPTLKAVAIVDDEQNSRKKHKRHIFHELHYYTDKKLEVSYVYLRQKCTRGTNYYVVDQSSGMKVQEAQMTESGNIKSVIWQIRKKTERLIDVTVEADIDHQTSANNQELTRSFLGNITNLVKNPSMAPIGQPHLATNRSQQHSTIPEQDFIEDNLSQISEGILFNETLYYSVESQLDQSPTLPPAFYKGLMKGERKSMDSNKDALTMIKLQMPRDLCLLTYLHPVNPPPVSSQRTLVPHSSDNHYAWKKDWIIKKDGNLKSINEEMIKTQNGILSTILKRMGGNLFSGKGIMNVSLPVQCFGKESYLQNLCNAFAFAPIFLEKAAQTKDIIQRFKAVLKFNVGLMTLLIQMEKPFNPILGETYQGLIDGCPIYGQQISHHPPISSVFMKGRGYFIHGLREPNINIGIRSALGVMNGFFHVSFDQANFNRSKITFSGTTGEIRGLIYGERLVRCCQETIMFDQQQNIYCRINYNQGCVKGEMSKDYNTLYGELVKLNPNTDFNYKDQKQKPNKKDIVEKLGTFHGKWVDKVYFNDQLIFDTWKDVPCKVEKYPHSLESDATKRKDLVLRVKEDWDAAQDAKEQLEQLQRKDRNLRKERHP